MRNFIDKKLEIEEARKPKRIDEPPTSSKVLLASLSWSRVAPRIAGINIKNENLAALRGLRPKIRRIEIVTPERETPGRIANPWIIPV